MWKPGHPELLILFYCFYTLLSAHTLLLKAKMPSLLSVLPLHLTVEKIFWFCICSSQGILWNHSTHHSTLLSSAEYWEKTAERDLLLKLEYTTSIGSYLQQSSRPNAQQLHFMEVVVQIILKCWQVWDFARSPVSLFQCLSPLSAKKYLFLNVKPSFAWRAPEGLG